MDLCEDSAGADPGEALGRAHPGTEGPDSSAQKGRNVELRGDELRLPRPPTPKIV